MLEAYSEKRKQFIKKQSKTEKPTMQRGPENSPGDFPPQNPPSEFPPDKFSRFLNYPQYVLNHCASVFLAYFIRFWFFDYT